RGGGGVGGRLGSGRGGAAGSGPARRSPQPRQKPAGPRPRPKPAASAISTARRNLSPTRDATCASLPNDTAVPPSSRHQRSIVTEASGLNVLISSTRPEDASARSTARYSGSRPDSGYGPAPAGQGRRGGDSRWGRSGKGRGRWRRGSAAARSGRITAAGSRIRNRDEELPCRPSQASACRDPSTRSNEPAASTAATLPANRCGSPASTPD